jgi:hypothetical protein
MNTYENLTAQLYPCEGSPLPWYMSHAERLAVRRILEVARPEAALEVGTCEGGCLQQIQQHTPFAISIDIDPGVRERLAPRFPSVEFLTGNSSELIGQAFNRFSQRKTPLGFVLIDGDHSYQGVLKDLRALLQLRPERPVWMLMHDSSNPECRRGIADAPWSDSPFVHLVDLDFVSGTLSEDPRFQRQIWGGLALALLLPELRSSDLAIQASTATNYAALWRASAHYPSVANQVRNWFAIKQAGLRRRLKSATQEPLTNNR